MQISTIKENKCLLILLDGDEHRDKIDLVNRKDAVSKKVGDLFERELESTFIVNLKKKKVLVTGAAGFIGSQLTEYLVFAGYQVRAIVHYNFQNNWGWLETIPSHIMENIEVFSADITDPFAVQKAVEGCELVFHLAALIAIPYSYRAPTSYVETNVKGTLNVFEACRGTIEDGRPLRWEEGRKMKEEGRI